MKIINFEKLSFMKEQMEKETFSRLRFKVDQIKTIREWCNYLGYEFSINQTLTNIRIHIEHVVDTQKIHRVFNIQNIKGKCFAGFYDKRKDFIIVQNITANLQIFQLFNGGKKLPLEFRELLYGLPQMNLKEDYI